MSGFQLSAEQIELLRVDLLCILNRKTLTRRPDPVNMKELAEELLIRFR